MTAEGPRMTSAVGSMLAANERFYAVLSGPDATQTETP